MKSFLRSPFMTAVISGLIAAYMALVRATTRWEVVGEEHARAIWDKPDGVVWAFWHSQLMVAHAVWPKDRQPMTILSSNSRDGEMIAQAALKLGRRVIRGSTSRVRADRVSAKGGLAAFRQMVATAKEGGCITLTPDGPRGPRHFAREGFIRVAKTAGVAILPSGVSIAGSRFLGTWDRLLFPKLFSRGVIVYGPPIFVAKDATAAQLDGLRVSLEDQLTALMCQADQAVGLVTPVTDPATESNHALLEEEA